MIQEATQHELGSLLKNPFENDGDNEPYSKDVQEQHARLEESVKYSPLSQNEVTAIKNYSGIRFGTINEALLSRKKPTSDIPWKSYVDSKTHGHLLDAIDKIGPATENIHCYSGTCMPQAASIYKQKVGKVISSGGWISASICPKVGGYFADKFIHKNPGRMPRATDSWDKHELEDHVLHFVIPRGSTHGAYIAPFVGAGYGHEREFLIKPDTKWKVVAKEKHQISGTGDKNAGIVNLRKPRYRTIWSLVPHEG